jgi:acetate kinase
MVSGERLSESQRKMFSGQAKSLYDQSAKGEACMSTADSRTQIWTLPTNEEIVVARQSVEAVKGR